MSTLFSRRRRAGARRRRASLVVIALLCATLATVDRSTPAAADDWEQLAGVAGHWVGFQARSADVFAPSCEVRITVSTGPGMPFLGGQSLEIGFSNPSTGQGLGGTNVTIDPAGGSASYSTTIGASHRLVRASMKNNLFHEFDGDFTVERRNCDPAALAGGPPGARENPGTCNPSTPAACKAHGCVCDPVDTATGAFAESYDDLSTPGRGPALRLSRYYSSVFADDTTSDLSPGWTYSYGMRIEASGSSATVVQENGSEVPFVDGGSGYAPTAPRFQATLAHNGDGTWTFIRRAQTTFTFDVSGRLTAISDRIGYATTVTYPSTTTQVITDPSGRSYTLGFDGSGRLISATESSDTALPTRTVTYGYNDADGNLTDVVDWLGGHTVYTYVPGTHLIAMIRAPQYFGDTTTSPAPVVTNTYDTSDRVVSQTDQIGRTTTIDYTSISGATKVTFPKQKPTDASGMVQVHYYQNGLQTKVTKAYGTAQEATWQFGYDPVTGGLDVIVDPNGHITVATYDSRGNQLTARDATGATTSWTYNASNDVTSRTDPRDGDYTTTYSYDGDGNLESLSTPIFDSSGASTGQAQTVTYNRDDPSHPDDVTSLVDAEGNTWDYTYDSHGYRTSAVAPPTPENPAGNETTWTYNAVKGWVTSMVAPKGNTTGGTPADHTTNYAYLFWPASAYSNNPVEPAGLTTVVTDPLGHATSTRHDLNGRLVRQVDANDQVTTYTYDPAGQLTTETRPDSTTIGTVYDGDGTVASTSDGATNATVYGRDILGRVTSVTDPVSRITTYTYDPAGNTLSKVDPGGTCTVPKSGCTEYSYTVRDELAAVSYSDAATPDVTSVSYDAAGQRTAIIDAATGTHTWAYDSLGRVTSASTTAGGTITYGYDRRDLQVSITYPGTPTRTVNRLYDDAGRLESITDWDAKTFTYGYDPNSNQTSLTYPAGTTAVDTAAYDNANRVIGIDYTENAATIASLDYGYDDGNRLTSSTQTGLPGPASETYGYNTLDELTTVNSATTYAYDAANNPIGTNTNATQRFDAANQLCWTTAVPSANTCSMAPTGATTFDYDSRGNRTERDVPGVGTSTYAHDQANRLTAVDQPAPIVAAGTFHSLVLRPDGTLWGFGSNDIGQLGFTSAATQVHTPTQNPHLRDIRSVGAGSSHGLAARADGTVLAWGSNYSGEIGQTPDSIAHPTPTQIPGLAAITAVDGGFYHSIALDTDGQVWAWGANWDGQLGNGTTSSTGNPTPARVTVTGGGYLDDITAIATGGSTTLALKDDGTVWAWGDWYPGDGSASSTRAVQVSGLTDIVAIATGYYTHFALKTDGTVWSWGVSFDGMLGAGPTPTVAATPVQVKDVAGTGYLSDIVAIGAGHYTAYAVDDTGQGYAWGNGDTGQLGDGRFWPENQCCQVSSNLPVEIHGDSTNIAIDGGSYHALAARHDGTVTSWGSSWDGQIGRPGNDPDPEPGHVATIAATDATYTYDGDGLRVTKTSAGATTNYTWDTTSTVPTLLSENDTRYVYGPDGIPLEHINSAGNHTYYHHDRLGSIRRANAVAGYTISTASYDAYGNLTATTGTSNTPFGYAGQYTDPETGLQYLRARYYDPTTAQFLTLDPLVAITGSPYGYVANSPLNGTDPTGQVLTLAVPVAFALIAVAVVALSTPATYEACREIAENTTARVERLVHYMNGSDDSPADDSRAEESSSDEETALDLVKADDRYIERVTGESAEDIKKDVVGRDGGRYDLYIDKKTGDIYVVAKGGVGEPQPTGLKVPR